MNIELRDIKNAAQRLKPILHHTELDLSSTFSSMTGGSIYLKCENRQKTGSFKIRGASNKIASLVEQGQLQSVVASSAGNHAQGVAYAAKKFGIPATIVMPESAPIAKVQATEGYGAKVVLSGACYDDAYTKAREICDSEGATFLHPYNDVDVIAGQGTLGIEMLGDLPTVDIILVPAGGGGLLAGVAAAVKQLNPRVKVYGVQAEGANAIARSFREKRLVTTETASTIADGIAVKVPGDITVDIINQYADGVVTVAAPGADPATYAPVDFEAVGVTAVDEHTLTYTLTYDFPGFLSLLCYLPYEPAYGPLLEETGDQFATSAETTYSCGAFYLAAYESLETWVMKKNPENYDAANVFIDTISRIYNAEASVNGPEMIKRGEIDEATIGSDILDSWLADDTTKDMVSMDRPNTNYTYFYMFNFMPFSHEFSNWSVEGMDAEYEPENWAKAINNTNFRKAFLYGINNSVTLAVKAPEGYDNYKLNTITPPSFCANADGVDYLKCGDLANITEFFDEAKAKEYRDAAIPELTAAGVTFPIKVQLPYNPSSTDWDKQCQVLKQQLEGVLNDGFDFINIVITAGPSDSFLSSVRRNGKFAFLLCNWGADYSDPQTETDPFYQAEGARGSRYAFLRTGVEDGFITGDTADAVMNYMKAIEAAVEITDDINARYDAFANAEASLINNALVVPMGMSVPAYIATRLNYWEGQYASTGFSNKRLKGIHVLDHYVSMSEYEANRDAR